MSEAGHILAALADDLAATVSRQYRLERAEAARRILEIWSQMHALREAAMACGDAPRLARMRVYKDAASEAKAKIYFELRRYRKDAFTDGIAALEAMTPGSDPETVAAIRRDIAAHHVSTAERQPHVGLFHSELLRAIGEAASVLDVGAGVMPILFPFEAAPRLARYVACDRDAAASRALKAYARWRGDGRLTVLDWNIAQGWPPVAAACCTDSFDVALMLKLVAVVRRQQPELLQTLSQVPAGRIVVGGSREALAKRRSIERRERAVIGDFLREAGWQAVGEIQTPDEFAIVAERGSA